MQSVPSLKKEVEEWEQKYKSLESLGKLKEKVENLKNQMAWAFVAQQKRQHEDALKELGILENRSHKFREKVAGSKVRQFVVSAVTKQYSVHLLDGYRNF